jgi:hypothetical protein
MFEDVRPIEETGMTIVRGLLQEINVSGSREHGKGVCTDGDWQ